MRVRQTRIHADVRMRQTALRQMLAAGLGAVMALGAGAGVALASPPASVQSTPSGCVAAATGTPVRTVVGQPVTLVQTVCDRLGDTYSNILFSWGDGTTSRGTVSYGTAQVAPGYTDATFSATHVFTRSGGYPLAVTWTDDQTGLSSTDATLGVAVAAAPVSSSSAGSGSPTVSGAVSNDSPASGSTPAPPRSPGSAIGSGSATGSGSGSQSGSGATALSLTGAGVAMRDVGRTLAISVAGMPSWAQLHVAAFSGSTSTGGYHRLASLTTSFATARVAARHVTRVVLQLLDPRDPQRDSGKLIYLL